MLSDMRIAELHGFQVFPDGDQGHWRVTGFNDDQIEVEVKGSLDMSEAQTLRWWCRALRLNKP